MENHFVEFNLAVSRLNKQLQKLKTAGMGTLDLKGGHALCLCQLTRQPGMTPSQIGEACDLDAALVSRLLGDLTARKMLRREGAPERYHVRYYPTPAGLQAAERISCATDAIQTAANRDITAQDMETFYRVLHSLLDNFDEILQNPYPLFQPEDASAGES